MIFEVPICYEVGHIPPRHRNTRRLAATEKFAVKIREVEEARFPVAIEFMSARDDDIYDGRLLKKLIEARDESVMPHLKEIRWDGRNLYRQWSPWNTTVAENEAELRHEIETGGIKSPLYSFTQSNIYHLERRDREQIQGQITADTRPKLIAELLERIQDLVVFNGQIWEKTPEPAWELSRSRRDMSISAVIADKLTIHESWPNLHAANRFDEAWNSIPELGDYDREKNTHGYINVLMPEVLKERFDDNRVIQYARRFLRSQEDEMHAASVEYFTVYARLRDIMADETLSVVDDVMADAIRNACAMAPCDFEGKPKSRTTDLLAALDLWERSVSLEQESAMDNQPAPVLAHRI